MQEITSRIYLRDDIQATKVSLIDRVRHVEMHVPGAQAEIDKLLAQPHPRLMKSHLPASIFNKQLSEGEGKFIVVMRNVKDTLVSYYHFSRAMVPHYQGTWNDFFELFKAKRLLWGDWLDYNLGWWAYRDHPNVAIFKYEDLKRNRRDVIKRVAEFCQQDITDETLERITQETSFEHMKENTATNKRDFLHPQYMDFNISPFMRKGTVGDWKEYFSDEQNAFVEDYYTTEAVKYGLCFEYTI